MSETKSTSDESGDETPNSASNTGKEHPHEAVDGDPGNEHEDRNEDEQEPGFYATIETLRFKRLLRAVSAIVEECRIYLEPEGLAIQAVDGANVAMIDLSASAEVFEFYDASGGVIGVDIGHLYEVARMADASDHLHFRLDQETRKLHVRIKELEYTLGIIDPDTIRQEPDLPELEFAAELTLSKDEFARTVKAADMVADETLFSVDEVEEQFIVEANGDADTMRYELDADELAALHTAIDQEVESQEQDEDETKGDSNQTEDDSDDEPGVVASVFSLDYLKQLRTPIPNDGAVTIEFGEDLPATIAFDIADGTGHVQYMLAPRISTDT
jgi:proliferating cell nuclear antigen